MDPRGLVRSLRGLLGFAIGVFVTVGTILYGPAIVEEIAGEAQSLCVQADAEVTSVSGQPGSLTVNWTTNQNAAALEVWIDGPGSVVGHTRETQEFLREPGDSVTFEETGAIGEQQAVEVTVVSHAQDYETVIAERTVRI